MKKDLTGIEQMRVYAELVLAKTVLRDGDAVVVGCERVPADQVSGNRELRMFAFLSKRPNPDRYWRVVVAEWGKPVDDIDPQVQLELAERMAVNWTERLEALGAEGAGTKPETATAFAAELLCELALALDSPLPERVLEKARRLQIQLPTQTENSTSRE